MVLDDASTQAGFTIVETIVSIIVTALFLGMFFQGFMLLEAHRLSVARQAIANDIAYSNLRKFTTPPVSAVCADTGTRLAFTPEVIGGSSSITAQTVTVYPIGDCNGSAFNTLGVKIESKVVYDGGKEVVHASIVK